MELVVDPASLDKQFPRASAKHTVRVRMLATVEWYSPSEQTIGLTAIPTVIKNASTVLILLANVEPATLSPETVIRGQLVEACGFYDGNEVLLYLLKPLDNEGFSDPGLVEMLRKHSSLPLLNHKGC